MDALLFAGEWQKKESTISDEGGFTLVDEIQEIAAEIAPDWPQYSMTKTHFMGPNSRFVTPYEHPVCCYGKAKRPIFKVGKEVEGYEGVFELTYLKGVKPIITSRPSPTPKDPSKKLFALEGFEGDSPTKITNSGSRKSSQKPEPADGGK